MNLLKRLKNLWKLSELVQDDPQTYYDHTLKTTITPPPDKHMAQIIKRSTPSQDFIKNNPQ
jgi:hypothetical protein